jgi:predicted metal-dependent hydrolase
MTKQLTDGKRGPGKPKAKIDPEHVKALASAGCTVEEIADFLGVNKKTLERRFRGVMEKGRNTRNVSLRRKQVELAMRGDKTMLIWLGKQFLGQSDKTQLSGKDDGPIKHQHSVTNLTDEQLDAEIEKLIGPITRTAGTTGSSGSGAPATP